MICGAGHVGVALLRMALLLGFDVTVLEDRPYFADGARRAGAKRVICDSFEQGLDAVDSDEDTYFVVMTRGHRYDLICLEKIAEEDLRLSGYDGQQGPVGAGEKKAAGAGLSGRTGGGASRPHWTEHSRGDAGGNRGLDTGRNHFRQKRR